MASIICLVSEFVNVTWRSDCSTIDGRMEEMAVESGDIAGFVGDDG